MNATAKLVALLKPKRTWLQFRLRSLFVLVVVAAVPCGLFKWKMIRKQKERRAVAACEKLGCIVGFDWEYDEAFDHRTDNLPPGPEWLRNLCGDDFFANVTAVSLFPVFSKEAEASMAIIQDFRRLKWLYLGHTGITDADLASLKGIRTLEILSLERTRITDAGLVHLKGLASLRELDLKRTAVSDAGIADLQKALPRCQIHR